MLQTYLRTALAFATLMACGGPIRAAALQLFPDLPSGQPVGTTIRWTAVPLASQPMLYVFSVTDSSGEFRVLRDAWADPIFSWTPLDEGNYRVRVVGLSGDGSPLIAVADFTISSRVTSGQAVVVPTHHPLVALYSAPPCDAGFVQVQFRPKSSSAWQYSNAKPCDAVRSANFYVAGMLASTTYDLRHVVWSGAGPIVSATIAFTTGQPTRAFPGFNLITPATRQSGLREPVILHSMLDIFRPSISIPVATDLFGRVIWYYDGLADRGIPVAYITRPVSGGTMLVPFTCCGGLDDVLLEIDLAGNPVRQTTRSWVNAQLRALGVEPIMSFHHEAIRLPNGQTLVLGMIERPGSPPTLGDMIIALDSNLTVVWTWNAFDHLDTRRGPVLGETCAVAYGPACPASTPAAIDWLHSNSIAYSPQDRSLILSMRHQDWLIKIDYDDGTGSGEVLWRLGQGGDFSIAPSNSTYPWFSHQHQAEWVGANRIAVFDNGNTRCQAQGAPCSSRGQVYALDEAARNATLVLNQDLGSYSERHGSAQVLSNGNFSFGSGWVNPHLTSRSQEISPDGTVRYDLETSATEYRSFRMRSLYTP